MNIILKGFNDPHSKQMLERAFRGQSIETCISILEDYGKAEMPEFGSKEHLFVSSTQLRERPYYDTDWDTITPLDEELVESLRHCEVMFLTMVGRYGPAGDMPYEARKRQYLQHLQYWNHILETKHIDLFFIFTLPHQCYDYVIYDLCKLKGIPVLFLDRCYIIDACFVVDNWEEPDAELREHLKLVQARYSNSEEPVPLSAKFEEYFEAQTKRNETPWNMFQRSAHLAKKSFLRKWAGVGMRMLLHNPRKLFAAVSSADFWKRKYEQHQTNLLYDQCITTPDLHQSYIYFPLHMQPEATTCPMGGAYRDQELVVQLLASVLPPNIKILVKEHPAQGETCRSKEFYEALHAIPSVVLVPRPLDTFQLMENSLAIATITGTAGYEGLFRGKPVIMFGHRFFQCAPCVYRVHSADDCRKAVETIVERKEKPTHRDMRIFLKAIEECGMPYVGGPKSKHEKRTWEEVAQLMGERIAQKL